MYLCIKQKQLKQIKMITIYGSIINGIHTDTSNTLHGAKCYATRNNIDNISIRYGYSVAKCLIKENNKWEIPLPL